jgi:hypothetical protein
MADTIVQENGSRVFFEHLIEKGKEPTIEYVEKNAYPNIPAIWYYYYQLQAKSLKKYLGNEKGYLYSRDTGIMRFLEKIASQKMGVSTKDNWNPMDIVMVKKNEEKKIIDKVEQIGNSGVDKEAKLVQLNIYMTELLRSKIMIPISLKGLTKTQKVAKLEEANLGGKKNIVFKLKPSSLKCDLDMINPPLLDTGEFSLRFLANQDEYNLQIRSFRYSKATTGPQTDITPRGGGAKLGKSSVKAIEPFLKKYSLSRVPSVVQDSMIDTRGNFSETQIRFWVKFYDKIKDYKIEGQKVDWDFPLELGKRVTNFEEILRFGLKSIEKDRNTLGRITSKLNILRYIELYSQISNKRVFAEWLETLYYGAKKEYSNLNGPFVKIY